MFAYQVRDPERYGVVAFDATAGRSRSSRSRPRRVSNWAVTGLYFYDAPRDATSPPRIRPSARGELEITDLNRVYLEEGSLHVERLARGCAWLDAGTPDSLLQAATFVQTIQSRQGMLVGCPEEVAFRMGFIDADLLRQHARAPRQDRARPGAAANSPRAQHRMKVERLAIPDVILVTPPRFGDARGFFSETWNAARIAEAGIARPVRAGQPQPLRRSRRGARAALPDRPATRRASSCAWCGARSGTSRSTSGTARPPSAGMSAPC